jgi:hypothetical protein
MAREQKSTDHVSGVAEQAMEQARSAADIYFEYVKQAISVTPSGGSEFAERIKECAEKNITMTQEFLKQLSQARNFQDVVRVQSDYMQFLMEAFGEQSLAEAYTRRAADATKKPVSGMSALSRETLRTNSFDGSYWLDMADPTLVLAMTQGIGCT